jgi:hypothetical protein
MNIGLGGSVVHIATGRSYSQSRTKHFGTQSCSGSESGKGGVHGVSYSQSGTNVNDKSFSPRRRFGWCDGYL